jgi:hypothetical protein
VKRASWVVVLFLTTCACSGGLGDVNAVIDLVRDPSPGRIAFYLFLGPPLLVVGWFLRELAWNLLPAWAKTRRAVWTLVAVLALLTAGAVTYVNRASPR